MTSTMTSKQFLGIFVYLICLLGIASAAETYPDYADEAMERTSDNLLPELYKLWVQRKMENAGFGIPIEHLMIRKSQRSPSLRLRFGRSSPAVSTGYFQDRMVEHSKTTN